MNNNENHGLFSQINEAIHQILKQGDDKVIEFVGSFVVIDPKREFEVIESVMFAYGMKDSLRIAIDGIVENIDKEKEDFINW